ncbi:hypothetical protein RUM43_008058 [Polyplax serrata]|uniref:Uncharacterized protein n=1 Tax=Polyplax serrata TaxID=468196 RepID=A0AAN8S265_POLSC
MSEFIRDEDRQNGQNQEQLDIKTGKAAFFLFFVGSNSQKMLTIAPYKKDIKEKDTAGIKQLQSRQSLSGRTGVDRGCRGSLERVGSQNSENVRLLKGENRRKIGACERNAGTEK